MRIKSVVFLALLCISPAARAWACSQCLCGTPFPADALGGVVPMQVRCGFEERYLSKANALEDEPGSESEREHRVSGFVLWRAHDRVALLARLPYNFKTITETPLEESSSTETAKGLGDAEASALVGLVHTNGTHATVSSLVLGVTIPTGPDDLEDEDGERLDAHLQPGAGAWSGTVGLNLAVTVGDGIIDGSVLGRANQENSYGYQYGNVLLFNAGYMSAPRRGVRLLAHVNGRSAQRDQFEDGTLGEHTGGTVVYLSPGARWRTGLGLDLEGAVQFPVIESLYGVQDEHTTARIALSLSR